MQITIDIDDKLYKTIKSDEYGVYKGRIYDIIRNGILEDNIETMPSVTPQQKMGKWLYFDGSMENYEPTYFYKCSVCRHRSDWYYKFEKTSTPNYCPNCGAKMEGKK